MFDAASVREDCVLFAASYPSPNVRRAVELAEAGTVSWEQVYALFHAALSKALVEVPE